MNIDSIVAKIAKDNLFIDTLETRNSDRLDFHDVSVWCLKTALEEAYKEGVKQKNLDIAPKRYGKPENNTYVVIGRCDSNNNETVLFTDEDVVKRNTGMTAIEYVFHELNKHEEADDIEDTTIYLDEFVSLIPNGDHHISGKMEIDLIGNKTDQLIGERSLKVFELDDSKEFTIKMAENPIIEKDYGMTT